MVNDWGRAVFAGFSDFDIPRVVDAGGLRVLAEDGGFNTQQVLTLIREKQLRFSG